MAALSTAALAALAGRAVDGEPLDLPRYRRVPTRRICHLGAGAFHRAHQAWVLHRLLQQGDADGWGICAIGLQPFDTPVLRALDGQDGLYSLWELDRERRRAAIVGSLMERIDASADSWLAVAAIADERTQVVSLTVTEAGYGLDGAGELDLQNPDIAHDLDLARPARSAPGVLVRALAARRAAGRAAPTLMSCDNLIDNGHKLRAAVLGLAGRGDPALARWIEREARFPRSMVDRITPASDAARSARLCAAAGFADAALIVCEPWLQWTLEDDFCSERPALERAGVVFTGDVARYEKMKVGLLNGGHSALAHAGLLLGHVLVHDAIADDALASWLSGYLREVAEVTVAPPGEDLAVYSAALLRRFGNPAIADRLARLAQDTPQKLQQALLPPLRARLERGLPVAHLATSIALWLQAEYRDSADAGPWLVRLLPLPGAGLAEVRNQLASLRERGVRAHLQSLVHRVGSLP